MSNEVIIAIIGAIATILAALITAYYGRKNIRDKEKEISTLANDLKHLSIEIKKKSGDKKPIEHYLLFWWRGEKDWADYDFRAAEGYIGKFQPTCGFSQLEALNAEMVTIVGGTGGVSKGVEDFLRENGCKVERLDGSTSDYTAELLKRRIASGKAFEGGVHRLGY